VQLKGAIAALIAAAAALAPARASADGEVEVRGAYYKEKATRVQQPMIDARLDAGEHGRIDAHFLVDVITSASAAAGRDGAEFREVRYEQGTQYTHDFDRFRFGGGYRISTEPDYDSAFVNLRGDVDLAQKNTVLGAGVAFGVDSFDDGNRGGGLREARKGNLQTMVLSLSASQLLSPLVAVGVNYDAAYLDGDQENFYREVIAAGDAAPEEVPETRLRHALFASVRGFVAPTKTTVLAGYRYYRDDWGVRSHTPELRVTQDLGGDIDVRARYRYYRQTAADFYRDRYDQVEEFMTDDPKLAAFTGQTFGLRLTSPLRYLGLGGSFARARAILDAEYLQQNNRFGDAFVAHVAVSFPIEY